MPQVDAAELVRSADGTAIAVWRSGQGKPLVAVHGVNIDHTNWDAVRPQLESDRTVVAMDRRGHGSSEPGPEPHSLGQEVEDLAAVIAACDGPVDVLAHSYGGLVALEAARLDLPIDRLIVYEPSVDNDPALPTVLQEITELLARGERERAVEILLVKRIGIPPDALDAVRALPMWPILMSGIQVLPREGAAMSDYRFDPQRFAELSIPTLVLVGEESPNWRHEAVRRLDSALPHSRLRVLAGQGHVATQTAPDLLAGEILEFLEV